MKVGKMSNRKILKQVTILAICVAAGWFLKARLTPQGQMSAGEQMPAPYVVVQEAIQQDITSGKDFIAHVEPINQVNLQPQISGYIEKVMFKEGALVNEGDLLFVIEQQKYIANVELREAELEKAKANFIQLEKEYQRQKTLNKQKYASDAKFDQAYSQMLQAKASVKQAEASYDLAKIDLAYTEITAPFTGYIGKAFITEGNFVSQSTGVLANIVQVNPIRVTLSVTDKQIIDLKFSKQKVESGKVYNKITLPNGKMLKKKVISAFSDNSINTATATIPIYVEFENNDNLLIPGGYVNIQLSNGGEKQALIISQAALAQDENGSYVMTVNKDDVVEQKRITLGGIFEGQQIVTSGLNEGEKVIIQGLQKVRDGIKVRTGIVDKKVEEGK